MICQHCLNWEARYHELVRQTLEMKRDGFTHPQPMPEPQPVRELPPDVSQAIQEVASPSDPNYRFLMTQAWARLSADVPPEQVAADIRAGEEVAL